MLQPELSALTETRNSESPLADMALRSEQEAAAPRPTPLQAEHVLISGPPDALPSGLPMNADAAFIEARRAQDGGRWEEAVQRYRQAISLDPALLEARNNLGHMYVRLNRLDAAIEEFRTVLVLAPDYAMARNNLGSAYLLSGQEELAIPEFLEAVRLDGSYVTPYYNLALVYARRGHAGQAAAFLTKALAIDPAVLSWVREEPDFAGVWESPEFRRWPRVRTVQR
jgi:tetratricopeptide (TPR) repeat protein